MKTYRQGDRGLVVQYILTWINIWRGAMNQKYITAGDKFTSEAAEAVAQFQKAAGLKADKVVGPLTWRQLCKAVAFRFPRADLNTWGLFSPDLGPIPMINENPTGKVSTFGGPDDVWDRCWGQKWLKEPETPSSIPLILPRVADLGLFRPEVFELEKWPLVTDETGKEKIAGLSWALNPAAFFCALRMDNAWMGDKRGDNVPGVVVTANGKSCVCLLTDYGPSISTKGITDEPRLIDISDGAAEYLGVDTDSRVTIAWAGTYEAPGPYPWKKSNK